MQLRILFELAVEPDMLWRDEVHPERYARDDVELAWQIVNKMYAVEKPEEWVDILLKEGPDELRDKCISYLSNRWDKTGLNGMAFAMRLGIHASDLSNIVNRRTNASLDKLMRLCRAASAMR